MKFTWCNLMPWPYLPDDFREKNRSVWVDIDQALLRIKEGSYGICARCSQPIDERRLEALPTARYDAACQAIIESANGEDDLPTL